MSWSVTIPKRPMTPSSSPLWQRRPRGRWGADPMAPVPHRGVVAVTGAAGFLGGWVVRLLLDKGYRVRACVRSVDDAARTGFLRAMPGFASGRLTLHAADLDRESCFDDIFAGCHG